MQNKKLKRYINRGRQKGGELMTGKQLDLCIKKIASGNREALRQLYDEMKNPIFLFALSLVKNYQYAEDVEQETFLNIMRSACNYQPGTNAKAWIFSIARNCCVDCIKTNSKYILVETETLASIPIENNDIEKAENAIFVLEALDVLEQDEQTIVALYLFSGLKQTEIAKVMNLPYMSVRSKYGYAIKKLKRYFTKKGVHGYERQESSRKVSETGTEY